MTTPEARQPGPRSARRPCNRQVHGILLLDKPIGISSNRALQSVRRLYGAQRAGHTGSLDPLATGMLPICFGEATKFAGVLLDSPKTYLFRMQLGRQTSTGDLEGKTIAEGPQAIEQAVLDLALESYRGTFLQTPPMYSALKQGGQPLYRLARAGIEVARAPRRITVHELVVEEYGPQPLLRARCSKGTYIRTLAEDIARNAGTVAHLIELRRLEVEPFGSGNPMTPIEELEMRAGAGLEALDLLLLPPDAALRGWPEVTLDQDAERRITQGQSITAQEPCAAVPGTRIRLLGTGGRFVGVGQVGPDQLLTPLRLLAQPQKIPDRAVS